MVDRRFTMINNIIHDIRQGLKKAFSFSGRATRREFWTFYCFVVLVTIILFAIQILVEGSIAGTLFRVIQVLVSIVLLIPLISVAVRRLHDVNLSGFWIWYLTSFGLPIVYMAYILDLDPACNVLVEKIQKTGSSWLGWILTILFWGIGAPITLFLIFLYAGKKESNTFGTSPYID